MPESIDPVKVGTNPASVEEVWVGSYLTNTSYVSVCIDFVPTEASTYFFFSNMTASGSAPTQSLYIKDFSVTELSTVCAEYASTNTLNDWTFTVNQAVIDQAVQRCLNAAEQEKQILMDNAVERLMEEKATTFFTEQRTNCLGNTNETLKVTYNTSEHHYTLYYYDQAGSLVQTVPPEGVVADGSGVHKMVTRYHYNSLNQLVDQSTPDAGQSNFYYNSKGQLRLSQNAQQLKDKRYSYTKYDKQGRIVEVGELYYEGPIGALMSPLELDNSFPQAPYVTKDVTRTYYDKEQPLAWLKTRFPQRYTRNRVSYVEVYEKDATDTLATFYSYDLHGNVKSLLQHTGLNTWKQTDYLYDLVSGNVNYVFYQYGKADQFIHRYKYDADNRIIEVLTSVDAYLYNSDARYRYFQHGPLARTELGQYRVQGMDYYYTLQGWIKGVNMPYTGDPGNDGYTASLNQRVGRDVFAYTLGYFKGDYKPIGTTVARPDYRDQLWARYNTEMGNAGLYNGNIAWMITDLKKIGQVQGARRKGMQAMMYRYDQLHRILKSRSLLNYTVATGFATRAVNTTAAYDEDFAEFNASGVLIKGYDGNGNLSRIKRRNETGALMDDFTFSYYAGTNKLRYTNPVTQDITYSGALTSNSTLYRNINITNTATVANGANVTLHATNQIDFAPEWNYNENATLRAYVLGDDEGELNYDAIGNLVKDMRQGVQIEWTPYGKVRKVTKNDGTVMTFRYDAAGNRAEKKVVAGVTTTITRYERDASGNVMAVYSNSVLSEIPIYGSTRLGQYTPTQPKGSLQLGLRRYELSNHLGNVLAVISDKIHMTTPNDSTWVDVLTTSDYYAFGSTMPGRTWGGEYRYGFQGQEKVEELGVGHTTAQFWEYDASLGRRWNVDPAYKHYISNYVAFGNNPLIFVDPLGNDWFVNHQGFYVWSEFPSVPGFDYAGNVLPEGTDEYKILTIVNGRYYHKYTQNVFATVGNFFGGSFVEHKPYDPAEESFNDELVGTAVGYGLLRAGGLAFNALRSVGGSIWKLPMIGPGCRGFVYEEMLALKGMMKSTNFPVIDAFYKGVATSIKTLDIFAKTYAKDVTNSAVKKQLVQYIDDLANFNGRTWGGQTVKGSDIKERVLEIGIPKGATESVVKQIDEAIKYAQGLGIKMNVRVVQ